MTLLGIAAVIAVAAVVIALVSSGGSDKKKDSTTAAQTQSTTAGGGDTSTTPTPPAAGTTASIQIQGGQPASGVQKIEAKKGEPLQITVSSDQKLPIHFHGYDIEKPTAPGKPAVFKLTKADIDGVFEMEIESTKTKIASITVKP